MKYVLIALFIIGCGPLQKGQNSSSGQQPVVDPSPSPFDPPPAADQKIVSPFAQIKDPNGNVLGQFLGFVPRGGGTNYGTILTINGEVMIINMATGVLEYEYLYFTSTDCSGDTAYSNFNDLNQPAMVKNRVVKLHDGRFFKLTSVSQTPNLPFHSKQNGSFCEATSMSGGSNLTGIFNKIDPISDFQAIAPVSISP